MRKIITEQSDGIGIIRFNRMQKRNALDRETISQILEAMGEMEKGGVRVLVLGAQPNAEVWCAGYDMDDLPNDSTLLTGTHSSPFDTLIRAICRFPAPVAAMVNGSVWGGACEMVLSCDLAIGDETSTFAVTPAKIGLPYSTRGIARFLQRLPLNVVKELFFTGRPVGAETAQRFQMLNHLVKREHLEAFTFQMARDIRDNAPLTLRTVKEQSRILSDAVPVPAEAFEYLEDLRRKTFESRDFKEGCLAFREKRKPVFLGE